MEIKKAVQDIFSTTDLDVDQRIWSGGETSNLLGLTVNNNDLEMVQLLLKLGFQPNSMAIGEENLAMIRCLVDQCADVNALGMGQQTALFSAAATGNRA